MIEYENSAEILNMDFDLIIPFEFHVNETGIRIVAYDVLKDIAEEFKDKFKLDYFADAAFDYLFENIKPYTDKWGYTVDIKHLYTWGYSYHINKINTDVILDTTVKHENMFVTMIDKNIVSFAEEHSGEIGVETDINYQNRGYGASNVAALAKYLADMNITATYYCDSYNTASQRLAEKVGFVVKSKDYSYYCYKNGE